MDPLTSPIDPNLRVNRPDKGHVRMGDFSTAADSFPRHVLVVDDEPLIRWSVSETLSDLGYEVVQAADARTALRMVAAAVRVFDVAVVDLRLPDIQDLSLLATLRQLMPGTALILMTAFGTAEIMQDAQALGATVLDKPFELDELRRLVSEPGLAAE